MTTHMTTHMTARHTTPQPSQSWWSQTLLKWMVGVFVLGGLSVEPLTYSAAAVTQKIASVTVTDIDGKILTIPAVDHKFTVIMFLGTDCPIANFYIPAITRLHQQFNTQDVQFLGVYSMTGTTLEQARLHHKDYAIPFPVVIDHDQSLALNFKAKVLSETVVLNADGQIVYQGRIDDQYVSPRQKRIASTTHDLQNALTEIIAGKTVTVAKTNAVGCKIETKR